MMNKNNKSGAEGAEEGKLFVGEEVRLNPEKEKFQRLMGRAFYNLDGEYPIMGAWFVSAAEKENARAWVMGKIKKWITGLTDKKSKNENSYTGAYLDANSKRDSEDIATADQLIKKDVKEAPLTEAEKDQRKRWESGWGLSGKKDKPQ